MTDLPSSYSAIPTRLGVTARFDDRGLVLDLRPAAEVLHHGAVRASVLAYMVDAVAGVTIDGDETTWTFTTDLSIRVRPGPAPEQVTATTVVLREGRRSATLAVDLVDGAGAPVAAAVIGFARVPRRPTDPPKPIVEAQRAPERFARADPLVRPLRDEAGVVAVDPAAGVAELPVVPDVCNPAGTLQGAMVALLAEAAAEDLATARAGTPMVVVDLDLRYLAQTGAGPVRTRCRPLGAGAGDPVEVTLHDVSTGRLTTLVHARATPPARPSRTAPIARTRRHEPVAEAPTHETRMLIDGKLVEGEKGTFTNVNPATEEVLGEVADASAADMHRAIDAARRAFDETTWSTDRALRQRCLLQLHDALVGEQELLREELIREVGCPRMVTHGPQLDAPLAEGLTYPARLIDEYPWEVELPDTIVSLTGQENSRRVWREPVGVVGAIVPWNYPFEVTINKLGQALATGNTVVLKPAPDTPFNATRIGRLVAEQTDIPPGVLNVVPASDHFVGEELTLSPKVDLISFTGSTVVGQRIMEKGAATMKRLFLELGGKSAAIVLDDADLAGASMIGLGVCMHAGQGCATPTRMLLPRSRYDEGVEHLKAIFETITPGDPQAPDTLCGPVINPRQRARIVGYVQRGIEEGATALVGGPEAPAGLDRGWYVTPTLFVDVDNSMTIAREEIFGPVLVVIPYEDDDDAVRIANDSSYGLAGFVVSESLERSTAVARRLRAGSIGLNGGAPYGADLPFGGYKASGVGRQNGVAGFDQYLEVKSVCWPTG